MWVEAEPCLAGRLPWCWTGNRVPVLRRVHVKRRCTAAQVTLGQEEVDEVITRDIHRTFPEHPQFGFAQGQQALFRVLKAYSLHDLEVCPYPLALTVLVVLLNNAAPPCLKG